MDLQNKTLYNILANVWAPLSSSTHTTDCKYSVSILTALADRAKTNLASITPLSLSHTHTHTYIQYTHTP